MDFEKANVFFLKHKTFSSIRMQTLLMIYDGGERLNNATERRIAAIPVQQMLCLQPEGRGRIPHAPVRHEP